MDLAPICLFTYNRLEETLKTVETLRSNFLASKSDLFVFSDGPKNDEELSQVMAVRKYLKTITGFKTITIKESRINKGLAHSIISGVSEIINFHGNVIVLEDDIITSPNFLSFMNQALDFYAKNEKIYSISGYTSDLVELSNYDKDYYYGYRASSWGWSTWLDRWEKIDWNSKGWISILLNPKKHIQFMKGGSDMPFMLWKQMNGIIDSWAIRFCFDQFKKEQLTVFPSKSKLINIGFNENATHTKRTNRYRAIVDESCKTKFEFDSEIVISSVISREFRNQFSIIKRLKGKFKR